MADSHATAVDTTSIRNCATTSPTWTQQRNAASLGMWLFLVTEIMFFGGLFCAYLIYRLNALQRLRRGQPAVEH